MVMVNVTHGAGHENGPAGSRRDYNNNIIPLEYLHCSIRIIMTNIQIYIHLYIYIYIHDAYMARNCYESIGPRGPNRGHDRGGRSRLEDNGRSAADTRTYTGRKNRCGLRQ